jgi:shikimate dehydrogenase
MHRGIALFGHNISYTISPFIHNTAFSITRLPYTYIPIDIPLDRLPKALEAARTLGFAGANVTIPYKEQALKYADSLSEPARRIGAVNTLRFGEEGIHGENTDGDGFYNAYADDLDKLRGKSVLILGAGGAARAVIDTLIARVEPSELYISGRHKERAVRIRDGAEGDAVRTAINIIPWTQDALADSADKVDGIIQTTPVGSGSTKGSSPVTDTFPVSSRHTVIDLIYNPPETPFLRRAAERGARTQNGLGMLLHQAALAFALWTGRAFPMEQVWAMLANSMEEITTKGGTA